MEEEWREIEGFNGMYLISNKGRVKSYKQRKEKFLSTHKTHGNYIIVNLSSNGKNKSYRLHRLVAKAFIPNKDKKEFVNHIDGNKHNNSVSNLEWCTRQENEIHAWKNGMKEKIRITSIANSKTARKYIHINKPVRQFDLNMNFIKEWDSAFQVQKQIGIDSSAISKCCRKKLKKAGGYIWQFVE